MDKKIIKLILYLNEKAYKNKIISFKEKFSIQNKLGQNEFNRD